MQPVYNCKYIFSSHINVVEFSVIGIILLAVVSALIHKHYRSILSDVGLPLLTGGGLLNLYERLDHSHSCVLDYFDFFGWFMFNWADLAFSVGFVMVLLSIFFKEKGA